MLFSSYVFILLFLPAVVSGYYLLARCKKSLWQRLFLIAASLYFYAFFNVAYLALILSSIAVNYIVAKRIQLTDGGRAKFFLTAGVLFNVGLLGYFKYYDFFVENINAVLGTDFALKHILLPLGISFFTFQQLSFLVSVYKREEKVERLRDYSLFVTFFPQLVAGPIVLYSEMIPQFKDETKRYFNPENFAAGIYMFSIGLFKKAVVADTFAFFADNGFGMPDPGLAAGWAASISYTLQIYFDFSGYSDMSVGLGKMFNIDIPFNFLSPYRSESVSQFWRTWHITLGRALSTYVYRPLGGNRQGLPRTCANLLLTFFVSGLWHGAAWTFVLWGTLHGLLVTIERILGLNKPAEKNSLAAAFRIPRIAVTFLMINALWVLFRAETFSQAVTVYQGMLSFGHVELAQLKEIVGNQGYLPIPKSVSIAYIFGLVSVFLFVVFKCRNSAELLKRFRPSFGTLLASVVLFVLAFVCLTRQTVFIYFNF